MRQISSPFIEAKNDSVTALPCGRPDSEKNWITLFILRSLQKVTVKQLKEDI